MSREELAALTYLSCAWGLIICAAALVRIYIFETNLDKFGDDNILDDTEPIDRVNAYGSWEGGSIWDEDSIYAPAVTHRGPLGERIIRTNFNPRHSRPLFPYTRESSYYGCDGAGNQKVKAKP